MKMKQLEERTGLGREAIRYYIRQGLLPEPEKPGPNVANYSEDHVERIGLIRKLKDERFLPLGVIKTILDNPALEQGNIPNLVGLEFLLAARLGITGSEDQTLEGLVASTSLELHELEDLANEGLVALATGLETGRFVATPDNGVGGGLNRAHADALREKRRGVALALTAHARNALRIGNPAQRSIGLAALILAIIG